eukprot:scaffold1404_cov166-Amphora_coffeaeformis.AAC.7
MERSLSTSPNEMPVFDESRTLRGGENETCTTLEEFMLAHRGCHSTLKSIFEVRSLFPQVWHWHPLLVTNSQQEVPLRDGTKHPRNRCIRRNVTMVLVVPVPCESKTRLRQYSKDMVWYYPSLEPATYLDGSGWKGPAF